MSDKSTIGKKRKRYEVVFSDRHVKKPSTDPTHTPVKPPLTRSSNIDIPKRREEMPFYESPTKLHAPQWIN